MADFLTAFFAPVFLAADFADVTFLAVVFFTAVFFAAGASIGFAASVTASAGAAIFVCSVLVFFGTGRGCFFSNRFIPLMRIASGFSPLTLLP
ncbi:MAG TPA: hypothetical protein VGC85_08725 [Chthoniobacterales bacterium]